MSDYGSQNRAAAQGGARVAIAVAASLALHAGLLLVRLPTRGSSFAAGQVTVSFAIAGEDEAERPEAAVPGPFAPESAAQPPAPQPLPGAETLRDADIPRNANTATAESASPPERLAEAAEATPSPEVAYQEEPVPGAPAAEAPISEAPSSLPAAPPAPWRLGAEASAEESRGTASSVRGGPDALAAEAPSGGGAPTPVAGDPAQALASRLAAAVEARKAYPEAARRRGTEGAARVALRVGAGGGLVMSRIASSSGSQVLDRAALDLVASVFPVENPARAELDLELVVRYSLRK